MPDLTGIKPIAYERFYLSTEESAAVRIQKKGDVYEYETKQSLSSLEHDKQKKQISKNEFELLKRGRERDGIQRIGYIFSTNPEVSIKIYQGRFEGLVRAEVEFSTREEAEAFIPPEWMGAEITDSPLGADARLLKLGPDDFTKLLLKLRS